MMMMMMMVMMMMMMKEEEEEEERERERERERIYIEVISSYYYIAHHRKHIYIVHCTHIAIIHTHIHPHTYIHADLP